MSPAPYHPQESSEWTHVRTVLPHVTNQQPANNNGGNRNNLHICVAVGPIGVLLV
jgi:hypothetical protein